MTPRAVAERIARALEGIPHRIRIDHRQALYTDHPGVRFDCALVVHVGLSRAAKPAAAAAK